MSTQCDKYNKKIIDNKDNDIFIIFYSDWCGICKATLDFFKENKLSYKGYNIDKIDGNLNKLIQCLTKKKDITDFNPTHKTRPVIFKKGKFIGGLSDLKKYVKPPN